MEVAKTILSQLGGNRFVAMTGSRDIIGMESGIRMTIAKNMSRANRLTITLDADDTYSMRFYRHTCGHLNRKTYEWIEDKFEEVKQFKGIYCDQLQEIFTEVTGMYTRL